LDAARLVSSTLEIRDRAILLLLLKTGIRNHELLELDLCDIDLGNLALTIKPAAKRSNRDLFLIWRPLKLSGRG
jgi:integrase/recombinase XerD